MKLFAKFYSSKGSIRLGAIIILLLLATMITTPAKARAANDCDDLSILDIIKMQSCTNYADVVRQIAVERDRGVMRQDINADLGKDLWSYAGETELVYDDPKFAESTPNEIAIGMLRGCRQLRRECKKQIDATIKKADQTASGDTPATTAGSAPK